MTAPKIPTAAQFSIATMWLESNEGENGEAEACRAVAEWLAHQYRTARILRASRRTGLPVSEIRKRLAQS